MSVHLFMQFICSQLRVPHPARCRGLVIYPRHVGHAKAYADTEEGVSNIPQTRSPRAHLQDREQHITLHVFPSPSINRKRPSSFRNLLRLGVVAFYLSIGAASEVNHDVATRWSVGAMRRTWTDVLEVRVIDFERNVVVPDKSECRLLGRSNALTTE